MTNVPPIKYISLVAIILCMASGIIGCKNRVKRIENQATITDSIEGSDNGSKNLKRTINDSVFQVHTLAAVFYEPDSLQLDSLAKLNKDHYKALVDEVRHNQNQAIEFLKTKNIKTFTTSRTYLQFEHSTGDPYTLNRHELKRMWGLLLYDHENPPREVDMSMMEYEYLQYFVK